jgi:hypothetical protein
MPETAFELAFTSPGARSMGLGGAFVALADDATAAFANPAGLVQLLRPEISAELRVSSDQRQLDPDPNDDLGGFLGSEEDYTGLGFISFVYPKNRWSLATYAHNTSRYDYSEDSVALIDSTVISSIGVSGAYRATEQLHLGLGIAYYERGEISFFDNLMLDKSSSASLGSLLQAQSARRNPENKDWSINTGFLWNVSSQWNIGGFYRQGPRIDPPFPDVYGLGAAFRTKNGNLAVSFEWDHVGYSGLAVDYPDPFASDPDLARKLSSTNELHLGAEYAFLKMTPIIAVRVGMWTDPDPRPRSLVRRDDTVHIAAGLGMVYKRFQLDLGADHSEHGSSTSISMVFTF